jgi:hypothetical protein
MNSQYLHSLEASRREAVAELIGMITSEYPSASLEVSPGVDDPDATHIIAVVDMDDPDEVMDLVIDRLVELQVDDELPISVIPIRTPERTTQLLQTQHKYGQASAALHSRSRF